MFYFCNGLAPGSDRLASKAQLGARCAAPPAEPARQKVPGAAPVLTLLCHDQCHLSTWILVNDICALFRPMRLPSYL